MVVRAGRLDDRAPAIIAAADRQDVELAGAGGAAATPAARHRQNAVAPRSARTVR